MPLHLDPKVKNGRYVKLDSWVRIKDIADVKVVVKGDGKKKVVVTLKDGKKFELNDHGHADKVKKIVDDAVAESHPEEPD